MNGPAKAAVSPANTVGAVGRIRNSTGSEGHGFREVLAGRAAGPALAAGKTGPAAVVQQAVQQLDSGNRALDRILEMARRGRRFTPQELLVLQAEVYRFTEQAALVTKVAEQASAELKRLWQLQV